MTTTDPLMPNEPAMIDADPSVRVGPITEGNSMHGLEAAHAPGEDKASGRLRWGEMSAPLGVSRGVIMRILTQIVALVAVLSTNVRAGGAEVSIVGTWQIKSFTYQNVTTKEVTYPFGRDVTGYVQYSPGGA